MYKLNLAMLKRASSDVVQPQSKPSLDDYIDSIFLSDVFPQPPVAPLQPVAATPTGKRAYLGVGAGVGGAAGAAGGFTLARAKQVDHTTQAIYTLLGALTGATTGASTGKLVHEFINDK